MDRQTEPDDDAMQALIGQKLRNLYDEVLNEPIPDNLVELLMKLDDVPVGPQKRGDERAEGE